MYDYADIYATPEPLRKEIIENVVYRLTRPTTALDRRNLFTDSRTIYEDGTRDEIDNSSTFSVSRWNKQYPNKWSTPPIKKMKAIVNRLQTPTLSSAIRESNNFSLPYGNMTIPGYWGQWPEYGSKKKLPTSNKIKMNQANHKQQRPLSFAYKPILHQSSEDLDLPKVISLEEYETFYGQSLYNKPHNFQDRESNVYSQPRTPRNKTESKSTVTNGAGLAEDVTVDPPKLINSARENYHVTTKTVLPPKMLHRPKTANGALVNQSQTGSSRYVTSANTHTGSRAISSLGKGDVAVDGRQYSYMSTGGTRSETAYRMIKPRLLRDTRGIEFKPSHLLTPSLYQNFESPTQSTACKQKPSPILMKEMANNLSFY